MTNPIIETFLHGPPGSHYRIGVRAATEAGIALADWRASVRPQRPSKRGVKLTAAVLRRAGACRDGTKRFRALFPRGLVITSEIVPVLIAGGLMCADTISPTALAVMRTPAPLLISAGCAIERASSALRTSRCRAAEQTVSLSTGEYPAVLALREAAWGMTSRMQHDGPDHASAAHRLCRETHDAISRYRDARFAARRKTAEARAAEWEAYTASLADWIERLNRDWWTAWADALLATREA